MGHAGWGRGGTAACRSAPSAQSPLAGHLRRPGARHGRDVLQLRHRRLLGVGRRPALSAKSISALGIRIGVNYVVYAMTH